MLWYYTTIILILTKKSYDESALNEKKRRKPYQFKIVDMLPEWMKSKNDFNEAKRLIDDIEINMNKVEVNREDKFISWYLT